MFAKIRYLALKNQISDIRPQKNQLSDITPTKKSNIRYQGTPVPPPPPPPPPLYIALYSEVEAEGMSDRTNKTGNSHMLGYERGCDTRNTCSPGPEDE